jgi:hypothetical protein
MVVDVTDLAHPVEVAFAPGNESGVSGMKTCRRYAYIGTEGFRDATGAISPAPIPIVDLAGLPASVQIVSTITAPFATTHTLGIDEDGFLRANATQSFTEPVVGMRNRLLADSVHPVPVGQ